MVRLIALNDTYLDDRRQSCVTIACNPRYSRLYRGPSNEYQRGYRAKGAPGQSSDKSANQSRRCPGDRRAMDLHWQSIKFLRPIYIDWFIHRIEAAVNKCTVVRAAPRISPFTTESPEKRKGKGTKKGTVQGQPEKKRGGGGGGGGGRRRR